jgi:A/G-specific adenine glycosylase
MHEEESIRQRYIADGLTPQVAATFRALVYRHYRANRRPMPWRETRDPYRILVSEVMLQQTRVERVRAKYAEFTDRFPDAATLAAAPLADILAVWQGLGYNRRALALKRAAEAVTTAHGGEFPRFVTELERLPGIGPYTARAVATFAWGETHPFIETNIRAVYIHCFFHDGDKVHDRELLPLVEATLDRNAPREWYYALMDYGVMLKKTLPNPGRRSAHHVRQSPFEGSNRELRSRLLRTVLVAPGKTAAELAESLAEPTERVAKNLKALAAEGLVAESGTGYRVP